MAYRGRVKNGVVVLDEPIELPDGTEVKVDVLTLSVDNLPDDGIPTLFEQLQPFVGKVQGLPPDASVNLDYHLYGVPREE